MQEYTVQPQEVRGLGNVIPERESEDFEVYTSSVTSSTEEVNGVTRTVFTMEMSNYSLLLSLSETSITYGESVIFTATITDAEGNPVVSDTISFYNGSTLIGTGTTDSNGVATYTASNLAVGNYSINAVYSDGSVSVTSATVSLTVNTIGTTISVTGSDITYGNNVVLTGVLSIGSGYSVAIYQDNVLIDTVTTTTDGAFTCTVTGLNVSSYVFKAVYAGSSIYSSSQATVTINVVNIIPTITLTTSSGTALKGETYVLSGNLTDVGSGASVKLYNGTSLVDTVTTGSNGNFTKTITGVVDIFSYHATFEGDGNYGSATSSDVEVIVLSSDYVELTLVGNDINRANTLTNSNNENIIIDYGDNTLEKSNGLSHTYSVSDTYTIKIYNVTNCNNRAFSPNRSSEITSVILTDKITSLGEHCFNGVTSSNLNIPSSVTSIGFYCFNGTSMDYITLNWTTSSAIVSYSSLWNYSPGWGSSFKFKIPSGTTSLYTAKGYPSDKLDDGGVTVASVSLTGSSSILSYADSDTLTLTATVLDDESAVVEGESVEFFNGSTSMGTATTNSSGVATMSYSSTGAGDVSFSAECSSISSEIYEVEDCTYYNSGTLTGNTTLNISNIPVNFNISFKTHYTSSSGRASWLNIGKDTNNLIFCGQVGSTAFGMYKKVNGTQSLITSQQNIFTSQTDYLIEWTYEDGVLTAKTGTTTLTGNHTITDRDLISTSIDTNNIMKELKIKPL